MNLTKKIERNKEQIIETIEQMFNNFDVMSIDCEYHRRFVEYYTISVYTLSNNINGIFLNAIHAKHVMDIDYYLNRNVNDDDFVSIDTDFIFYVYPDCLQLYMQCYNDSSIYQMIHLKTIYTTADIEIIKEIENLIK